MGVVNCDNMLLLLGVPQEMIPDERKVTCHLLMEGFRVRFVLIYFYT